MLDRTPKSGGIETAGTAAMRTILQVAGRSVLAV